MHLTAHGRGTHKAKRELIHVGLAQNQPPGRTDAGHAKGIVGRAGIVQGGGSRAGDHAGRIEIVLEQHRGAVQRACWSGGRIGGVQGGGIFQRGGTHGDDAVQLGPLPIIGSNPVQVPLDQLHTAQLACRQGLLYIGDGRLNPPEASSLGWHHGGGLCRGRRGTTSQQAQCGQ